MKRLHVGWLALCASAAAAATPAVWTGGGGGDSVGEAGNWDRADAVERLADGSLLATFASAGTGASVDRAVAFFGVVFDTPHADGFALSAGGASAALGLGGGGLSAAARAAAGTYRVDVPVVVNGDQTWEVGANASVTNVRALRQGPAPVAFAVAKTGPGSLYLDGDGTGDFRGDFRIAGGGTVYAFGEDPFGRGAPGGGVVSVSGPSADLLLLGTSTHTKPVTISATNGDAWPVQVLSGSTVTFRGAFTSRCDRVRLLPRCRVVLEGGGRLEAPPWFMDDKSELLITNRPVYFYGGASHSSKGTVTFAAPSNDVPQLLTWYGLSYRCAADWAFYKGDSKVCVRSYYDQFDGHWELGGHDQRVDYLVGASSANELRNTGRPATLYMAGRTDATNYGPFTGAFNLSKGGPSRYEMGGADGPVVNGSTGYLEVTGGTLAFSAGSSWARSEDIRVDASASGLDAVLSLGDGAALSRTAVLTMADGASARARLDLADGVTVLAAALVLNGRPVQSGLSYGSSESPAAVKDDAHFSGKGIVYISWPATATPAVWTGGGGGGSVGEAGNWDRADAVERLADGSLLATFASAGTGASVDRAVAFFGVVFDTPHADGFALSAGGASAALGLGGGGLSAAARAAAGTYRVDVPVVVNGDQTWEVGANASVTNVRALRQGPAPVAFAVAKTGPGSLYLDGDGTGDFRGDFRIAGGGTVYAFGEDPFGRGAPGGGVVSVSGPSADLLLLGTSTHTKPVTISATNGDAWPVQVLSGSTVTFRGAFTSRCDRVRLLPRCRVVLEGGGRLEAPPWFMDDKSELLITNRPVYFYGGASHSSKGTVTFAAPSNDVPQLLTWYGLSYRCAADWAFYKGDSKVCVRSYYDQFDGHWELGGHDQRVDYLVGASSANELRNTGRPATLYMAGRTDATNYGPFTGAFNLSKGGPSRYEMGGADGPVVNGSTGYLEVTGGTLAFSAGSSWARSEDIRVDASASGLDAVLSLGDGAALSRTAVLTMADGASARARLDLADGVSAYVRHLFLNGREAHGGRTYGSSQSPAAVKDDVHFSGAGTLYVRGTGSVLLIR